MENDQFTWSAEIRQLPIFYPKGTMVCTDSLYFYFSDFSEIIDLFLMTVELASKMDESARQAAYVLVKIDKALDDEKISTEELEARRDASLERIRTRGASKKLAQYATMNARHLGITVTLYSIPNPANVAAISDLAVTQRREHKTKGERIGLGKVSP